MMRRPVPASVAVASALPLGSVSDWAVASAAGAGNGLLPSEWEPRFAAG